MSDQTYNGWTNYETWNINLWMSNEQGSVEYWDELAAETYSEEEHDPEQATYQLAGMLQSYYDELAEEFMGEQSGPFADLLNVSLSRVNWHEIAEHLIDNLEARAA